MIIDEKGRLFGKLNILDILFVLILIILIAGAYMLFSTNSKTDTVVPVTYTLEIKNCDAAYFANVHIGEQVTDGVTKAVMGRIVDFKQAPAEVLTEANNKIVMSYPKDRFDGYVTIEAQASVVYPDLILDGEPIKIGQLVAYRSESLAMRGYIIDIQYDIEQLRGMK
ncbi:MAG: DUF4330 domain-containing protein [Ruminococcaceae bacterium]|nr:DUF4330 domain-containing protein [Oscillospiraceae bacterium]